MCHAPLRCHGVIRSQGKTYSHIVLHSAFTLLYSTLLYSTLLYSTLLYYAKSFKNLSSSHEFFRWSYSPSLCLLFSAFSAPPSLSCLSPYVFLPFTTLLTSPPSNNFPFLLLTTYLIPSPLLLTTGLGQCGVCYIYNPRSHAVHPYRSFLGVHVS